MHLVIENVVFDFLFDVTDEFLTALVEQGEAGAILLAWTPEEGLRATRIGRDRAQNLEAQFPAEIAEFPASMVLNAVTANEGLFAASDRLKILGILKTISR